MKDRVSIDLKEGVADVRLIRADKMNALDRAMFDGIVEAGEQLAKMKGLRAVVLSGEGRAFCAGLDMQSFAAMGDASVYTSLNRKRIIRPCARRPIGCCIRSPVSIT